MAQLVRLVLPESPALKAPQVWPARMAQLDRKVPRVFKEQLALLVSLALRVCRVLLVLPALKVPRVLQAWWVSAVPRVPKEQREVSDRQVPLV
jgi:hypothetical protein